MCIICNMGHGDDFDKVEIADTFLAEFARSRSAMQAAADAMLAVSKNCVLEHRQRYDAIHKIMVRQIREWNKLEEKREHGQR